MPAKRQLTHFQEAGMNTRKPKPTKYVWAVVLGRESENATTARLLVHLRKYKEYQDGSEEYCEIVDVSDLATAARAFAQTENPHLQLFGPTAVFDYNPTASGAQIPTVGRDYALQEGLHELDGAAQVHRPRDALGNADVPFYVLVNAREPQQIPMQIATVPAPVQAMSPLDWVRSNYRGPDGLLKQRELKDTVLLPTADIPRQGRDNTIQEMWSQIHQNRLAVNCKPLPYVFGTAGAGKTATLRYIAQKQQEDIPRTVRNWAAEVQILAVTFNGVSPIGTPLDDMLLGRGLFMAPIVARLLFVQQSAVPTWSTFASALLGACNNGEVDATELDDLGGLFVAMGLWTTSTPAATHRGETYVVLLVDELVKVEAKYPTRTAPTSADLYADHVRTVLCHAMDNKPFYVVFSSLSAELMNREVTVTNRPIFRFALPLLAAKAAEAMIKSQIRTELRFKVNGILAETPMVHDMVIEMLALLSGGHPRTVERICTVLAGVTNARRINDIVEWTVRSLFAKYQPELKAFPLHLLLDVFTGVPVLLEQEIPESDMTYDKAIKSGYLINNVNNPNVVDQFLPTISEIQLRVLCQALAAQCTAATAHVFENMNQLLGLAATVDGKIFEEFHMCWEIIRQTCITFRPRTQRTLPTLSVAAYYKCTAFTGALPTWHMDLSEAVVDRQWFKSDARLGALAVGDKLYTEFPPSLDDVAANPALLCSIWKPKSDTCPAIDFVIFVRVFDQTGESHIIALVFQTKYSDKYIEAPYDAPAQAPTKRRRKLKSGDESPAFKSSIDRSTVAEAYGRTERIMAHAGWTADKFIYIVHAYRDTAGVLAGEPPGDNCMTLNAETLETMYGSFGCTLRSLSLRNQVRMATATPSDAEGNTNEPELRAQKRRTRPRK